MFLAKIMIFKFNLKILSLGLIGAGGVLGCATNPILTSSLFGQRIVKLLELGALVWQPLEERREDEPRHLLALLEAHFLGLFRCVGLGVTTTLCGDRLAVVEVLVVVVVVEEENE